MIGTKQKVEIAFLVVSFLDATRLYQDGEIDEFIARNVKSEILQRRGYSIDHLRRAMVDNGFLQRQPDGSRYWVNETFQGPDEQEQAKTTALNVLALTPQKKVICPYCNQQFSQTVILQHYLKKHSLRGYWQKRLDQYFETKRSR